MPTVDAPSNLPQALHFIKGSLPFLFFALWGGAANYVLKVKNKLIKRFSILELLGDFVVSGFSGILAYLVANEMGLSTWMTAASVGIAGHLGSQTVTLLEKVIQRFLESKLGVSISSLEDTPDP